jgi:hypothetical protein
VIGESSNTSKPVISIEESLPFRTILVLAIIALGDVILLLGNDPTVCTIIGRYGDFNERELFG